MKFQNPSFNIFFERTDKHTNGQAESNMLPTFSKLGGIKTTQRTKQWQSHCRRDVKKRKLRKVKENN